MVLDALATSLLALPPEAAQVEARASWAAA
jgi:hypothetical protein